MGGATAVVLGRLLEPALYVSGIDPASLAIGVAVLLVGGVIASVVPVRPARRRSIRCARCGRSSDTLAVARVRRYGGDNVLHNLRDAARQLNRRPGLSLVIVAMLAIGIGVTTGIFSLFQQILLRPLPVPEPQRLVNLAPTSIPVFSYPMFRDLEARQDVFTGLATYDEIPSNLGYEGLVSAGDAMAVSASYFEVLGLEPALGRLIGAGDEPALDEARVAVLSHEYWRGSLGGNPGVMGRTITVNGEALTIVGVAPAEFTGTEFASAPQVFVPLTLRFLLRDMPRNQAQNRFAFGLNVFGRLRPDIDVDQASARINALHSGIITELSHRPTAASAENDRARARRTGPANRNSRDRGATAHAAVRLDSSSCCSSFAATSPTCCWRAAPRVPTRWRFAAPSARTGVSSCRSCWPKQRCWR